MVGREQFTVDFACPHCAQKGNAVWEENARGNLSQGVQRRLVNVSAGFHTETGRTQSGDPAIICDRCDTIQPD